MADSSTNGAAEHLERHRRVEYGVRLYPDQVGRFRITPSADGRETRIEGVCPGCGGYTATVWVRGSGNSHKGIFGGSSTRSIARVSDRTRMINCECGHAHRNRPEAAPFHGCGAHWLVELP
ncbi:hypothetical protein O7626_16740 [Micromonospora sp. WMMD1102]|uniref:hypothetical protein n=1 Tax=Micromonospora sp. WMMD1102 TaxID=3016105 RepID=UPI002414E75C|nr:hypothetical protein [Micromonospora sp. WMMD1102]MDG4787562.1 hypothetical protein [Micromonospora sp. WMMD1102]